jgi:hypothetical protein
MNLGKGIRKSKIPERKFQTSLKYPAISVCTSIIESHTPEALLYKKIKTRLEKRMQRFLLSKPRGIAALGIPNVSNVIIQLKTFSISDNKKKHFLGGVFHSQLHETYRLPLKFESFHNSLT